MKILEVSPPVSRWKDAPLLEPATKISTTDDLAVEMSTISSAMSVVIRTFTVDLFFAQNVTVVLHSSPRYFRLVMVDAGLLIFVHHYK